MALRTLRASAGALVVLCDGPKKANLRWRCLEFAGLRDFFAAPVLCADRPEDRKPRPIYCGGQLAIRSVRRAREHALRGGLYMPTSRLLALQVVVSWRSITVILGTALFAASRWELRS